MTDCLNYVLPRVRKDELVIQSLNDEVLIYDLKRHRAHCLNSTAALIWQRCDGRTTIASVVKQLEKHFKTSIREEMIWYTLEQFDQARLLEEKFRRPSTITHLTRRELMSKAGKAAVLSLPLVTSILAPAAAQAASCLKRGTICVSTDECCTGNCIPTGKVFRCR